MTYRISDVTVLVLLITVNWTMTMQVCAQQPKVPAGLTPVPPPSTVRPALDYEAALIAALHHFAERGETEYMLPLLEKHPRLVNARLHFVQPRKPEDGDKYAPLHRAVLAGQLEAVQVLLKHKADIEADGGDGWTPLHLAAMLGKTEVCRVLLQNGAKTTAHTSPVERGLAPGEGLTPRGTGTKVPAQRPQTPLDIARHTDSKLWWT